MGSLNDSTAILGHHRMLKESPSRASEIQRHPPESPAGVTTLSLSSRGSIITVHSQNNLRFQGPSSLRTLYFVQFSN